MDLRIDLTLDRECWACEGTGTPTDRNKDIAEGPNGVCSFCDGTGREITEFGSQVLAFVKLHAGGKNERS